MKCTKYKKYLYLNEDELTEKEKSKLNEHLKSCTECSNERSKFYEYNKYLTELRNKEPELKNGAGLTNDIIRIINNKSYSTRKGFIENVSDILSLSAVRYSLITLLFFIISSFFVEAISTSEDISRMETAMSIKSSSSSKNNAEIMNVDNVLKSINNVKEFLDGNRNSVDLPSGWMMLKKSDLLKSLSSYDEFHKILKDYSDIDLKDFPLLNELSFTNKLDEKELELILSNSKELEKEILELKERAK